jgi:uncharacterized protein YqgC (DUF456 family)
MDVWTIILFIGTLLIMLVGLAGVILPVIPGIPLIWVCAFVYGLATGFEEINWNILGILAVLTGFTIVLDYVANLYGAKKMGATGWGILGALFGMLVGLFTAGLIGLLVGSFAGAVLGELLAGKTGSRALKAGIGTFLGFLGGTLIKLILGCMMIGIFLWKVLF